MHEFEHILLSWQHWAFEGVSNVVYAVPAFFYGRYRLRKHDRAVHGVKAREV